MGKTAEEKKAYRDEYRRTHKDLILGQKKRYREKHAEQIKESGKKYKDAHRKPRRTKKYATKEEYYLANKERAKEYYKNNKEHCLGMQYKYSYGIDVEEYNRLFEEQGGCCKICGKHQSDIKGKLNIDHDHNTGKVRGLLCTDRNRVFDRIRKS